jgi:hypothetical protein
VKIKSQKNLHNFEFNRESLYHALKIRPFLMFFTTISIFSILSLMLILYGAVLQKNQTAATIQQLVFNASETKLSVFSNYIAGFLSSPDSLYIDVEFEGVQLLNYARESALLKGIITDKEQEVEVKAKLSVGSEEYKVKLSPTGQNLDMIGSIDKRAYKVKVLEGKKIYGMEEFKLLPPTSRNNIVEWVGHALENKEDLIALRYFFIEVTFNGDNLGVYAIEEHFNKELLENRKAREGIIFSAKPNQIKIFNEKKISKDINKRNQIRLLKSMLQSVKNKEIEIDRIFDLEKFASHFAIIDLMDGYHAVGDNSIYYLNPVTNLIEPITREYNSLRYSDGQPNVTGLMIDIYQGEGDGWAFANKLFNNSDFTEKYLTQLLKLSEQRYLDEFFEEIDEDLNIQTNIIYKDDPFYKFPKEYLYERQKQIIEWLNQDLTIVANIDEDNHALYNIKVKNNSPFPVELIKFFAPEQNFELFSNNIVLSDKEVLFPIDLEPNVSMKDLNFSYKIYGIHNKEREAIIVPKSFSTGVSLSNLWNTSSEYLFNNSDVIVDHSKMTILFDSKVINIKKDLFIPENFIVKGQPGLTINLLDGASIYSKSAFNFNGSIIEPIKITSSDRKGGGLVVISPKTESIFINTIFEHLASPNLGSSGLTASITIYDTNASFHNCIFAMNESEDFLNLINSKYELSNLDFKYVKSDAFDSDYSNGSIINSIFTNIGNDAMDFSGSISDLSEIRIDGVGDKVLSAGEKSKISGKHIDILNAEIGITSKDLSEVDLINVKIKDTRLGFAVFQKKAEYGPSKAKVAELEMTNVDFVHLVDLNSTLNLNGKDVINKRPKVENFLYGANFGKSSK